MLGNWNMLKNELEGNLMQHGPNIELGWSQRGLFSENFRGFCNPKPGFWQPFRHYNLPKHLLVEPQYYHGNGSKITLLPWPLALAGKFKKWSKNLGSVLKRCEYYVRSTKKNLGSIGGSLEEPQPKHVHWCLAQRFAHCMLFARQFADLKNFTRYV